MSTNERDELADLAESIRSGSLGTSEIVAAIRAAGYSKPWTTTTVEELVTFPQGTKFYSTKTTHSWELNDLTKFRGTLVQGTGGGYTYLKDFIKHEAPLTLLYVPEPQP